MKIIRLAQGDSEGYFTGDVGKLNTQGLNTSEIQSAFNRANDAIQLAQSYPGGALQNINYIFNYSKSGSYGVYVPELERAQRTEELRRTLEQQKGYKVVDENGMLTAYPVKENKSSEEIQKEIKDLWSKIESSGGHVLGVNMNASLAAATENATEIQNDARNKGGEIADPQLLWQMLAILSVASTIIHEAAHAKGADEGGAQSEEHSFAKWAIDQINTKYKQELEGKGLGDNFSPIQFSGQTRHADGGNNWYKRAQYTSYLPSNFTDGKPRGSDLSGRSGKNAGQSEGTGDWAMLFQRHQGTPIEKRLSREFMSPLAKGLSQEHNTIEEQLRKQFAGDTKPDTLLIHEELLTRDHQDDTGYRALETLLEEHRPQPLLLPYKKTNKKASKKIKKIAQSGEFWLMDGQAMYADGDIGDMNHEAYVVQTILSNYEDEISKFYSKKYNSFPEQSKVYTENYDLNDFSIEDLKSFGMTQEEIDIVLGRVDARDYGLKNLGWKRVNGNNVETYTLTNNDLKEISNGLWEAYEREISESSEEEPVVFNIEVKSNGLFFTDIPYNSISSHDVSQLRSFRQVYASSKKSLTKKATLFGWYNNLSISDGSTIPGLGDRVMAWEDRDEDFARDDNWISEQSRYNPSYDLKGFYYRWIEPRFKPQLWDDMTQDLVNTHPAKRFAGALDPSLVEILNVLATIKDKLLSGDIRATRLIVTEDIAPIVNKVLGIDGLKIKNFKFGETETGDKVYAVWISDVDVDDESISRAEVRFQNKDLSNEVSDLAEDLLGISYVRMNAVSEIVNAAKEVCRANGVEDIYIVGVYSRERMMGNDQPDVEQLDFTSTSSDKSLKIGQLVAKKLNVAHVLANKSFVFSFVHKGIRVDFSGKNDLHDMMKEIRRKGVRCDSPLLIDLANRDFTINMFAFNIATNKVEDPFNVANKAMNGNVVETFVDPNISIKENPLIILRALKLKLRYEMILSENLQKAIFMNADRLFEGKITRSQLIFARESVRAEGSKEAEELFKQYRIEKINDVK